MKKFRIEDVLNGLKPIYSLEVSKYRRLQFKFLVSDNVFLNVIGYVMSRIVIVSIIAISLLLIGLFL